MKIFNLILLFSAFGLIAEGQKRTSREMTVSREDTLIKVHLITGLPTERNPHPRKWYYWYRNGEINMNKGGYSGKLLEGSYEETINDRLITKGSFDKGLKTGTWKRWYHDGSLREVTNWNKGNKHGKSIFYARNGEITESKKYKRRDNKEPIPENKSGRKILKSRRSEGDKDKAKARKKAIIKKYQNEAQW